MCSGVPAKLGLPNLILEVGGLILGKGRRWGEGLRVGEGLMLDWDLMLDWGLMLDLGSDAEGGPDAGLGCIIRVPVKVALGHPAL